MIRVVLPFHLRTLARVDGEVLLDVGAPVTRNSILDALEARYPMLRGTIRDHDTRKRRPLVRFYACNKDLSHDDPDLQADSQRIERAVEAVLAAGETVPRDLGGSASCTDMTAAICRLLR